MEVIDRPNAGSFEVGKRVALRDIRAADHAEDQRVRAEMDEAGKGGKIRLALRGTGADQGDRFHAREAGCELDADELVHRGDVGGGDRFHEERRGACRLVKERLPGRGSLARVRQPVSRRGVSL